MVSRGLARGLVDGRAVRAVVTALAVLLVVGCGGGAPPKAVGARPSPTVIGGDAALAAALSVRYDRLGKYGEMDQTLTFTSTASVPMTVTASLVAFDAEGQELPGVTVSSVFGTERGARVLMPGANVDAMVFAGSGLQKVRDVAVRGISASAVAGVEPAPEPVTARVVNVVEYTVATRFAGSGVLVENPNGTALDVQVVLIIWNRPAEGESQQAEQVLQLGHVVVPAHGKREVKPSAADAATIERFGMTNAESLKAFVRP